MDNSHTDPVRSDSLVKGIIETAQFEHPIKEGSSSNVKDLPLSPLPRAGFRLAQFILVIISGYIVFLIVLFIFTSFDAASAISSYSTNKTDSSFKPSLELIKVMQEEKKSYREYVMQTSQMVLLNLLLPILTAILGYMFGSREEHRKASD